MNETVQHRVLTRVRKMLRLAEDAGASEGERDNALRMAHATLAKYNLDIEQVPSDSATREKPDEPRESQSEKAHCTVWARQTAHAIAGLFFCAYFYTKTNPNTDKGTHTFVGRHSNVVTAKEIALFAINSIHKEASRYQRDIGGNYGTYRAFAEGATLRIYQRCKDLREAAAQQRVDVPSKEPGTALVLADVYRKELVANTEFLKTIGVQVKRGARGRATHDATAREAGKVYGGTVALNRQIK